MSNFDIYSEKIKVEVYANQERTGSQNKLKLKQSKFVRFSPYIMLKKIVCRTYLTSLRIQFK